ncbi:MAG: hypothetical protein ACIAQZ_12920 [Sedimentisphaeraceae bacterium JB056]
MKDLTKTIFSMTGMYAMAIMVLAVSPSLRADNAALPKKFNASAMLVRIGADEFEPIQYDGQESVSFFSPRDIAMSIYGSSDSEPVKIAEMQMTADKNNTISGETKSSQSMRVGAREIVTDAKTQDPYYLTKYFDLDDTCDFKLKISPISADEETPLNCWCSFNCDIYNYTPYENLNEQTTERKVSIPGDRISKSTFEINSTLAINIGQTVVVSTQKIGDDFLVLLLHVSD